jgi:hypothetical protein
MKFWRAREEVMPHRDVQAEAALGISNAAQVLPAGRFMALVYWAIITNRQISTEAIDDLANRLSRAAWERARK